MFDFFIGFNFMVSFGARVWFLNPLLLPLPQNDVINGIFCFLFLFLIIEVETRENVTAW